MTKTMNRSVLRDIFKDLDARSVLQDIVGVGEIVESGDELIHRCPLPLGMHKNGDSNPSASLNKDSLLFNCFTCGGGSIIWLLQICLDITKDEAIAILKNEVSDLKLVPVEDFINKLESIFADAKITSVDIPYYSENIIKRFEGPCDYLTDRGVSVRTQSQMRTGLEHGRLEIARTAEGESITQVDRVVLPHFIKGRLSGWVARKVEDIQGVPKYRNSKGFPRGAWLYNLDNVSFNGNVYVVESPMSVLVLKSRGIDNIVATFGAKVDKHQIELLRNFNRVTVFMDGDTPGRNATQNLVESLNMFTKVSVIDTPDDEDPASLESIPDSVSALPWLLSH